MLLEEAYQSKKFELIFMPEGRGNNRIEEIIEFIKDKRAIFLSAINYGTDRNMDSLRKEIEKVYNAEITVGNIYEFLREKSKEERVLIILNNVDKFISKDNADEIAGIINKMQDMNAMVVALSQNDTFDKGFVNGKISKYITGIILQKKENIFENDFYKDIEPNERFIYYAIFGTTRKYFREINKSKSVKENLLSTVLNTDSFFRKESNNILREELREPQVYNVILETIANGAETLNEISEKMHIPTSICNKYTTVLISLGILDKIKPVCEENSRKSKYLIHNYMQRFCYRFLPNNVNDIDIRQSEKVYEQKVKPEFNLYLAENFKDICMEYLTKQIEEEKIKMDVKEKGSWWDKDDKIDVVVSDGLSAVMGDCYWNEEKIGIEKLKEIERKSQKINIADKRYYLFSKRGFTDEIKKVAKTDKNVTLVNFEDMFGTKQEKGKKMFFFRR